MVELPEPGAGIGLGVKLTVVPAGAPLAERLTALLKPPAIVLVMVESKEAVACLPELLKIDAIDAYYFGQNDLAESMGYKGDRKNPRVRKTVEDSIKRVADAGRVAGMNVQDEIDAVAHYMKLGLRWINVHQKQFMARGSKAFLQALAAA